MRPLKHSFAVIALVILCADDSTVTAQQPGSQQPPPDPDAPKVVQIKGGTTAREVSVAAIRKAAVGRLTRYGQQFDYTPFVAVLKLAGITPGTRVRVVGEEEDLILQAGSKTDADPAGYAVIFNPRGFPVLTPSPNSAPTRPGSAAGLPPAGSGGGLPPPGSGGGARPAGGGGLPPAGSGGGAARAGGGGADQGPGTGPGPGAPSGFDQLREVRRFEVIEILR
jgi:uncharacterized membrane protein YgcG